VKCGKKSSRIFNIFGEIGEGGGTANIAYMNDVTNGFADNVDNTLSKRSKGGMDGFAEYTKNKWIDDGVNIFDEGPDQHIFATKTNKLDDFIVLKKGTAIGDRPYGWDHIMDPDRWSEFVDYFGEDVTPTDIKNYIDETLSTPDKVNPRTNDIVFYKTFTKTDGSKAQMKVWVVSNPSDDLGVGTIATARPSNG